MQYSYKIIYDIKKDMWNWRGAVSDSFMGGFNCIDSIDNAEDLVIARQIANLRKQPAEMILKPYLLGKKSDRNNRLNKFIKLAEDEFRDKYVDACKALERITKHPMASDEFIFYVTTFPRMTVFFEKNIIFMYDSTEGVWGMPIDGFLHEALHFQFYYYWRLDNKSPVSKLSEDEFSYLKEALTVILDEELKPIITLPDCSYPQQINFRSVIHDHWKKYHDFDRLVEFGLEELSKYIYA